VGAKAEGFTATEGPTLLAIDIKSGEIGAVQYLAR
jgi:hypothetical protein